MDRFQNVLLAAGLGCFFFAFVLSCLYPWMITDAQKNEATIADVAKVVSPDFKELKHTYPNVFNRSFKSAGEALTDKELVGVPADDPRRVASEAAWPVAYADALRQGRDIYVAEACWHCHSQYVRPVAHESQRFGKVRTPADDNNALQRPVLWGTRRVGPDLTHEGGLRSNDWHVAHFANPRSTTPGSVMPSFPWFFDDGFYVARKIDPETAELEGLSPNRTYRFAGHYRTKAEAEAAIPGVRLTIPDSLEDERDRLVVEPGRGPNQRAIAVIAYLQWLGTWEPKAASGN